MIHTINDIKVVSEHTEEEYLEALTQAFKSHPDMMHKFVADLEKKLDKQILTEYIT